MANVVVIGAGTMGAGIAAVAAAAGYEVSLIEPDQSARDRAREVTNGVQIYETIPSGLTAEIAIEAVPERLDLKRAIFKNLAAALGSQTLLATNTSSLSVTEIAEGIASPERILGMHFFNPPAKMKLAELVRAEETSDDAIVRARAIAERFGKTPVVCADMPGFIVNRVARPYYLQAMRAYEAGVAPLEDLDRLARGAGFRMGPFELMDLIGLDVNLVTSESIFERTKAARLEPVPLQRTLVGQNRLGRKTGAGFYEYATQGHPEPAGEGPRAQRAATTDRVTDERIVILGFDGLAAELQEALQKRYANVELFAGDDLDDFPQDVTIAIDVGDGSSDRSAALADLDARLAPESLILADAYATDIAAAAKRMRHPQRLAGYGILASLAGQRTIEIADAEQSSDDALELAQEIFESMEREVVLVENLPGLFLGRTVGSIVNEAVYAVQENVATPEDIDLAMQLGTNYPHGPIAWGRAIGAQRVGRILQRLAAAEGAAFAPHRALWVLDVQSEDDAMDVAVNEGAVESKPGDDSLFRGIPL